MNIRILLQWPGRRVLSCRHAQIAAAVILCSAFFYAWSKLYVLSYSQTWYYPKPIYQSSRYFSAVFQSFKITHPSVNSRSACCEVVFWGSAPKESPDSAAVSRICTHGYCSNRIAAAYAAGRMSLCVWVQACITVSGRNLCAFAWA